jgi:hypothetical protein
MSESHKCFTYLTESAPKWLSEVSRLEKHVEEKQKEILKTDYGSSDVKAVPAFRDGSIASIRGQTLTNGHSTPVTGTNGSTSSPEDSAHPSASRRRNVLVKKSRQTPSLMTSSASGPPKFRSRSMIIVYYDAEIQRAFEKLVREIGNGRHLVRKAKLAAKAEAMSSRMSDDDIFDFSSTTTMMGGFNFRRAGSSTARYTAADDKSDGPLSAFDRADKALEKAQSLCERAAHQFLRDGDCRIETESAKGAFQEVLEASTEELRQLEVKMKASAAVSCTPQQSPRSPESNQDEASKADSSQERPFMSDFSSIEVDEDEEQMPVVKLPTLRMTSRMGPRMAPG